MKRRGWLSAALFVSIIAITGNACKKDNVNLPYREYRLYNYSSGSAVDAGFFRVQQLSDSNSKIYVSLNQAYRTPNVQFAVTLNTQDTSGGEFVYSNLGNMEGSKGELIVQPVIATATNQPIRYTELIQKVGYFVKVMSGSNVQARGTIE